jgi:hypothetical protein
LREAGLARTPHGLTGSHIPANKVSQLTFRAADAHRFIETGEQAGEIVVTA